MTYKLQKTTFALLLLALRYALATTNIATFSDAFCKDSYRDLDGPNGYPNGTCTMFQAIGDYTSFQVVNKDPGCNGKKQLSFSLFSPMAWVEVTCYALAMFRDVFWP